MADDNGAVFVSYTEDRESREMAAQIERSLQARGIQFIHTRRDLGYGESISDFRERIGRGTCVIVLISHQYLRSSETMTELVEIASRMEFRDRIFPIVLGDADIYDPLKRIEYVKYWEVKRNELAEAIKTVDPANLQGIREDMDLYDRIRDKIAGLASMLTDIHVLTPDMHRDSDFSQLYAAIEQRLADTTVSAEPVIAHFEPATVLIPAGPFLMGSPLASGAPPSECPQHTVTLPAYRIGIYPLTNLQYEEFVREKNIPVAPVTGWNGQRVPSGRETYPVAGVTWYEALAYCEWLSEKTGRSYTLPNEAQWEKACRGGSNFVYPWGDELESGRSNQGGASIAAVDAYPPQNGYGCFDMVGNVRQWTTSLWGERRSQPDPRYLYPWKDDQRNSLTANPQIRRVVRGSSMRESADALRCSARNGQLPHDAGPPGLRTGFRVVMNLDVR